MSLIETLDMVASAVTDLCSLPVVKWKSYIAYENWGEITYLFQSVIKITGIKINARSSQLNRAKSDTFIGYLFCPIKRKNIKPIEILQLKKIKNKFKYLKGKAANCHSCEVEP